MAYNLQAILDHGKALEKGGRTVARIPVEELCGDATEARPVSGTSHATLFRNMIFCGKPQQNGREAYANCMKPDEN
jgi:hypothetical protein